MRNSWWKIRKVGGSVPGYGGAAVFGALVHRAYQNWQVGQQANKAPVASVADVPQQGSRFWPLSGADGKPFALALIRSMIAAANADGQMPMSKSRSSRRQNEATSTLITKLSPLTPCRTRCRQT